MRKLLLLLVVSLAPIFASASNNVESDTAIGTYTKSEDFSAMGRFGDPDRKTRETQTTYTWNAGVTSTTSISSDPTTGQNITDKTTDFSGGLGLDTPNKVKAGAGLDYSTTPDEKLTDFGPNAYVGYTHEFKHRRRRHSDDLDDFNPDIGGKLGFTTLNYGLTQKIPRSKTGQVLKSATSIRQNAWAFALTSNVTSWFYVKISETLYSYNKDPNAFLAFLDSKRVLANRTAGISGAVNGFPQNETGGDITFYLPDDWSLDLSETVAKSIIDGTNAYTSKVIVAKDVGDDWNIGVGYENDNSDLVKDNLALLNIKYYF